MDGLTPRVEEWRAQGSTETFRGYSIQVRPIEGGDPVLLILHGFPSSSYDFRELLAQLGDHAALTFDFLGFGFSEKPRDHTYSLFWQADLAEELLNRHFAGRRVFVVGHDMGSSVGTEILARDIEGKLSFDLQGALLFNGSLVLKEASLTPAQKLLRSPIGPIAARLSSEWFFRRTFAGLFSPSHPLSDEEAADQWALYCNNGGRRIGHKLIYYLHERIEFADRWHGAIRDWPGALNFTWGLYDPVATTRVLDAVRKLRPEAPVEELPELGHYPQLEDPARVAEALKNALERSSG